MTTTIPPRLKQFIEAFTPLARRGLDEDRAIREGGPLLRELIARDDWLPDAFARPDPLRYRQFLLYRDPDGLFSIVSFVWGPGQSTPIHDHTVWGLIGMLRGTEISESFAIDPNGVPVPGNAATRLTPGTVEAVGPETGDIHRVSNAHDDRVSVSIHVYGADIGAVRRWVYPPEGGRKLFVSGYSNDGETRPFTLDATPHEVRQTLSAGLEIALLDLREEGPFAEAHPLFAASLPLSRLELEIFDRVPRRETPIVVYDADGSLAPVAIERLAALGYGNVRALAGGLDGWRAAGGEIFRDVNVPSKAFGELVESRVHTPSLPAPEVKALLDAGKDVVILDSRRFEEYSTMSIPTGISVPGAELVLRAASLAPDPATTVIVNCAGRTRSLIGAQSLVNAGLPNPVYALRNGTIGWTLAGFTLDRGQQRRFPEVDEAAKAEARAAARAVAYRAGVRWIDRTGLDLAGLDRGRTLYRLDVRTPEEYRAGHLPGFLSAPGGQLVQETDHWAPVRGARLVLFDTEGVRADMTASWLAQLGWDVAVLGPVPPADLTETGDRRPLRPPPPAVAALPPATLRARLEAGGVTLIDLAPSPAFRRGHIPGAQFLIRARAGLDLPGRLAGEIVLTSPDGDLARFAAAEIAAAGATVTVLDGGTAAWIAAGLPLESGAEPALSPFDDVYRRPYEGTDNPVEAMQAYLDWEFGLVEQLRRDGTHGFYVI
ncbi:rhodanese-like domain-containing protein [Zavarzinia compransoris]|uniref:Sulfurtransferase n=1 Tax=Zavarzinia compransoris TaxID=1264899 RepID=A0A317DUA0_9PROT|nr:rhodanese-like domain-containing protein [Zavarzinia compransoris]PWR18268.1 sulfurtransferase [Zavarzinia compransoris]TDP43676.1 putative metal-dependent enzyme (double-stranded beta helix superfamily) [Zavarzinia compransoris]